MNIPVEYKDQRGIISNHNYNITRLAFAKHLAIAGQRYAPRPQKFLRTIGMFLHYSYYLQRQAFYNNHFSKPPKILSDPTEQGQFSTLAGKAIADFLSKRIDGSLYTTNYESVASNPLKGQRPDLVAFTRNSQFTIEVKGRHQTNPGNMVKHKIQSASGNYPRNYSVACVSYNLYRDIKCKYHDPYNDNIPYDFEGLKKLTRKYYLGLSEFLDEKYFNYQRIEINGESFYAVELSFRNFEKLFRDEFPLPPFHFFELFEFYRPQVILPSNIRELAVNGISQEMKPFNFEILKQNNIYIDNDRIGLRIRR